MEVHIEYDLCSDPSDCIFRLHRLSITSNLGASTIVTLILCLLSASALRDSVALDEIQQLVFMVLWLMAQLTTGWPLAVTRG